MANQLRAELLVPMIYCWHTLTIIKQYILNQKLHISVLKKYEDISLKTILIWNFDETVVSILPEGQVPYKGPLENVFYRLAGGLKSAMGYTGNRNIVNMQKNCKFRKITNSGLKESHVHDVLITREAPNYRPS